MTTTLDISGLDDYLTRQATEADFAGVVLLADGEQVLFQGAYGPASRRWPVPVTEETRFDVASVTKLFTSVAVLGQVGAGRLDLDVSIHEYVDLAGTTISERVTLRHLLTHTSGIADDADEEAGESYEALWRDRPNYAVTQTADFLPQFAYKPANYEPGTGCRYCNCGYVLAGLALERATGEPFREHVTSHVLAPAGMSRSGFFDMRDATPDVAEGWERGPGGEWRRNIYSYPPIGSPDGGAHCTAGDLVRFMQAVRAGRLLPPELTEMFLTPQVLHHSGERDVYYGFGLGFMVADGEVHSYYKEGVNTGASALVEHHRESGIDVAVVSSSEEGVWAPVREISRRLRASA